MTSCPEAPDRFSGKLTFGKQAKSRENFSNQTTFQIDPITPVAQGATIVILSMSHEMILPQNAPDTKKSCLQKRLCAGTSPEMVRPNPSVVQAQRPNIRCELHCTTGRLALAKSREGPHAQAAPALQSSSVSKSARGWAPSHAIR